MARFPGPTTGPLGALRCPDAALLPGLTPDPLEARGRLDAALLPGLTADPLEARGWLDAALFPDPTAGPLDALGRLDTAFFLLRPLSRSSASSAALNATPSTRMTSKPMTSKHRASIAASRMPRPL